MTDTRFDVRAYGAVGDGSTKDTTAIQAAVDACGAAGGGTVYFPAGKYLCGSIELRDGVTLYVEKNAVLKASGDLEDYIDITARLGELPVELLEEGNTFSFIYALHARRVGLDGDGIIDMSDEAFNDFDKMMYSPDIPLESMDEQQKQEGVYAYHYGKRPTPPLYFFHCTDVSVRRLTLHHAPFWTVNFYGCQRVTITGVTVDNRLNVANCDGIGISGCEDVIVSDCHITSADDCIAIGGDCRRVCITNCTLRSRSSAVRIGYKQGLLRDIVISNLSLHDCNRAFIIQAADDCAVENVLIQNVVMNTRLFAGEWWGKAEALSISSVRGKGHIRRVVMSNVVGQCENGIVICGQEQGNVSDIVLRDWMLTICDGPNRAVASYVDLQDEARLPIRPGTIPWRYCVNARNVRFENVQVWKADDRLDITPYEENAEILDR